MILLEKNGREWFSSDCPKDSRIFIERLNKIYDPVRSGEESRLEHVAEHYIHLNSAARSWGKDKRIYLAPLKRKEQKFYIGKFIGYGGYWSKNILKPVFVFDDFSPKSRPCYVCAEYVIEDDGVRLRDFSNWSDFSKSDIKLSELPDLLAQITGLGY